MQLTCDINHAYKTAPRFFPSLQSAVVELIQNAYRSYWPISPTADPKPRILLDFIHHQDLNRYDIRVSDFGRGIDSPERLLSLNTSKWADDVAGDQDPAGLGAMAPLAHAQEVEWASDFGAIGVNGEEFFRNAEYREFLQPSPFSEDPRSGGVRTRVTMRGCERKAWEELRSDAMKKFALYRLVTLVIDGRIPTFPVESMLPVVELPGMRVHAGRYTGAFRELWAVHGDGFDRTHHMHTVVWHGHIINLGPALYAALPHTTTLDCGLEVHRDAVAMCIEILDENMVTPQLPDRRFLVADERTRATVQAAWAALMKQFEVYLLNIIANPPSTADKFKQEIMYYRSGVMGWETFATKQCQSTLFRANVFKHGCGNGFEPVSFVLPKNHPKTYDLNAVVLRTPERVEVLDLKASVPGGLLLDPAADRDPLQDEGWYHAGVLATHVCMIDLPEEIPTEGPAIVASTANVYMIPKEHVNDGEIAPELDIATFRVLEDVDGAVADRDISYSSVLEHVTAFGWTRDEMVEAYRDLVNEQFEDRNPDPDDDPVKDFEDTTARLLAKWDNKHHVDVNLHALARQFNAKDKKLTIDFAAKTIEVDGKVTPVTWSGW